jgi:hypothetical protein
MEWCFRPAENRYLRLLAAIGSLLSSFLGARKFANYICAPWFIGLNPYFIFPNCS